MDQTVSPSDRDARAIAHMYRAEPRKFFQLAFRLLHPGVTYHHNWSIDVLGEALARCARGETRRLIVNMPPRSLKSMCCSVAFPAWLLGSRPDCKVMSIAGHRALAADQHDLARRLMTHERYRSLFPHVRVDASLGRLSTAHGGYRWHDDLLVSGQHVRDYAAANGIARSRVFRLLPLIRLGPPVLTAAFNGDLPSAVSLNDLLAAARHLDWNRQAAEIGIAPAR